MFANPSGPYPVDASSVPLPAVALTSVSGCGWVSPGVGGRRAGVGEELPSFENHRVQQQIRAGENWWREG